MTLTTPIRFGAWEGTAYHHEHRWWVAPRPICEFLGLDWRTQRRVIQRSPGLSVGGFKTPTEKDGKTYLTLMIPTVDVGLWLVQISPSKVAPEAAPALTGMQSSLRSAIEAQINEAFGIPSPADLQDLLAAPLPADIEAEPCLRAMVTGLRAEKLAEPGVARAALMFKLGLPGTKVGALLGRSAYWANKRRRMLIDLFVLEPRKPVVQPPANDAQIDLFGGEATNA